MGWAVLGWAALCWAAWVTVNNGRSSIDCALSKSGSFFSLTVIQSRITGLEDMKNQRLRFLRNKHRDTYNAVMWLRENQDKFENPVHEPILMQVSSEPLLL